MTRSGLPPLQLVRTWSVRRQSRLPMRESALSWARRLTRFGSPRCGRPAYRGRGRLVGYANLRSDALATRDSGRYDRRTFWLLPHDRGEAPETEYRTHAPLEAVDPRTVRAGRPGHLTARAWGSPLPLRNERPRPSD
ncbi:DUF6009 family protein [Actinacidiphila oryziradicis]|uniref:DUF6009 family protein n=1 Tax=Actinacidiphila oryziradicis TaxID=2571141 RepID=UPI00389969F5